MTIPLTPTAIRLPSPVAIPADGESVDSASVQLYEQTTLDGIEYASVVADRLNNGGTLTAGSDVHLNTSGASYHINGLEIPDAGTAVLTGDLSVSGYINKKSRVVLGGGVAGTTYTYSTAGTEHVYIGNGGVGVGVIWKITDSATQRPIRFVCFDSTNGLTIQTPSGSTIVALKFSSGFYFAATVMYDGASHAIIDLSRYP